MSMKQEGGKVCVRQGKGVSQYEGAQERPYLLWILRIVLGWGEKKGEE